MNKKLICAFICALFCTATFAQAELNIKFVNFKTCIEKSKIGLKEQESFESLKKQMDAVFQEKMSKLEEIQAKLDDADYLETISANALAELNRVRNTLRKELPELKAQYDQTLYQANMNVVQKLMDQVNQAANEVAKSQNIDLIVNEETTFFHNPKLDISDLVVSAMDKALEKEA